MDQILGLALPVKLNGHIIVAIVDTGSAGVVILKSCYNCLWMNCDEEVNLPSLLLQIQIRS